MKTIILIFIMIFSNISLAGPDAKLEVRNDYSFTIVLNVKCGKWLGDKFEYERLFVFREGKTTVLSVPKQYDRCQIWPSHKW